MIERKLAMLAGLTLAAQMLTPSREEAVGVQQQPPQPSEQHKKAARNRKARRAHERREAKRAKRK